MAGRVHEAMLKVPNWALLCAEEIAPNKSPSALQLRIARALVAASEGGPVLGRLIDNKVPEAANARALRASPAPLEDWARMSTDDARLLVCSLLADGWTPRAVISRQLRAMGWPRSTVNCTLSSLLQRREIQSRDGDLALAT